MNTNEAKSIQARAVAALQKEFGNEFVIGAAGGTVGEIKSTLKFEFKTADTQASSDAERKKFASHARFVGLEATDYLKTFNFKGSSYAVIEIALSRPKFPVTARRADGVLTKFTETFVKKAIAA